MLIRADLSLHSHYKGFCVLCVARREDMEGLCCISFAFASFTPPCELLDLSPYPLAASKRRKRFSTEFNLNLNRKTKRVG